MLLLSYGYQLIGISEQIAALAFLPNIVKPYIIGFILEPSSRIESSGLESVKRELQFFALAGSGLCHNIEANNNMSLPTSEWALGEE